MLEIIIVYYICNKSRKLVIIRIIWRFYPMKTADYEDMVKVNQILPIIQEHFEKSEFED